jgi:hypothetical protein
VLILNACSERLRTNDGRIGIARVCKRPVGIGEGVGCCPILVVQELLGQGTTKVCCGRTKVLHARARNLLLWKNYTLLGLAKQGISEFSMITVQSEKRRQNNFLISRSVKGPSQTPPTLSPLPFSQHNPFYLIIRTYSLDYADYAAEFTRLPLDFPDIMPFWYDPNNLPSHNAILVRSQQPPEAHFWCNPLGVCL